MFSTKPSTKSSVLAMCTAALFAVPATAASAATPPASAPAVTATTTTSPASAPATSQHGFHRYDTPWG